MIVNGRPGGTILKSLGHCINFINPTYFELHTISKASFTFLTTLEYLIIVGVRLLIFWQFSSHYALIPYPTFINFAPNVHPIPAKIQFLDKITQTMPLTSLNVSTFFKNFHPIRLFNTLRLLIHQ